MIAFAIGATLAAALEPMTRRVVEPAPVDHEALDAPTTAEQREVEYAGNRRHVTGARQAKRSHT